MGPIGERERQVSSICRPICFLSWDLFFATNYSTSKIALPYLSLTPPSLSLSLNPPFSLTHWFAKYTHSSALYWYLALTPSFLFQHSRSHFLLFCTFRRWTCCSILSLSTVKYFCFSPIAELIKALKIGSLWFQVGLVFWTVPVVC